MKINNLLLILFICLLFIGGVFAVYTYSFSSKGITGITDSSLSDIKKRGKLIIASDVPYGVMEQFDASGNISGIDIDIAKEIAKNIGVKPEFRDYDFDKLFPAVKSQDVDLVLSAITITPERAKEMLFSTPYFNGGQVIVIKNTTTDIVSPTDLKGKKVGIQKGTTSVEETKKYTTLVMEYEAIDEKSGAISDLKKNTINALVLDYIAAVTIVKEHPDLKISGEPFTQEFYGVVAKIGNDSLMNKVNETLREMKRNGKLQQISDTWLK